MQGIAVVPNSLSAEHILDNVDLETIQLADLRVQALYEMSDIRQLRLGQLPTDKVRPFTRGTMDQRGPRACCVSVVASGI